MHFPIFHDLAKREVAYRSDLAAAIKEWPEPEVVRSHTAARGPVRTRVRGISGRCRQKTIFPFFISKYHLIV